MEAHMFRAAISSLVVTLGVAAFAAPPPSATGSQPASSPAAPQTSFAGSKWGLDGTTTSMYNLVSTLGAKDLHKLKAANGDPLTGKGIGVALIDSGVAPVQGLNDPTRILNGPDLSFESQNPSTRYLDTFGHGTHMASIIAGKDTSTTDDNLSSYSGVAPDAKLISLKVATNDGATDVSQVIAGLDWTVAHRNDPGLNIRVINLSFGTNSVQSELVDPLSHAVESAWRNGIVVVVSVGNDGAAGTTVTMPAASPYVIAVGAADIQTPQSKTDDTVAPFSSVGNATRHADVLAPGTSIIGLRDPGSYVDVTYPSGLVPGDTTGRFFRGSGSSQAAAAVSGAVALLLQQRPTMTPDQVKKLLMSTTNTMKKETSIAKGAGEIDLAAAAKAATPTAAAATQTWPRSTGLGSLERARGTNHVTDPDTGLDLTGETDIMGRPWSAATWAAKASTGTAWTGGTWNGSTWSGTAFAAGTTNWTGVSWTGTDWAGLTWTSRSWANAVWDGRSWSSRSWSSRSWSGRSWCSQTWV
jgi:serine protease AprX